MTQCISVSASTRTLETVIEHKSAEHTIRVTLVFAPPLENAIPLLVQKTEQALELAEQRQGVALREDLWIYFDSKPDDHNGLTTIIPNNRISIQTEPPITEDSIGLSRDYLTETILHEIGHMIPLQQRGGIFALFDWVVGNASRPIGLWPRWIHEGLAVWTEAAIGGRPASGYIDLELRKYAEFAARNHAQPLESWDFDGKARNERVAPGNIPYHFGFLLIDELTKVDGASGFILLSSLSLGFSFRSLFRSEGHNLDKLLDESRLKWAATPLASEEITHEKTKTVLAESVNIEGPFSNEHGVSWIEGPAKGDARTLKALRPDGKVETVFWRSKYAFPAQLFLKEGGEWIVLLRKLDENPARANYRGAFVLSASGQRICEVKTPPRLREIDYRAGRLAWIRSEENGRLFAERGRIGKKCAIEEVELLASGRSAFERISELRQGASSAVWSRSEGTNSFRESLVLGDTLVSSSDAALSMPHPISTKFCSSSASRCYLAHAFSPKFWGPILVEKNGSAWHSRRLPLRTGSSKSAPSPDGSVIAVKESLWEHDKITLVKASDFSEEGPTLSITPLDRAPSTDENASLSVPAMSEYSAWPSIRPHFWVPMIAATPAGFLAMGSSFYEDLTGRWAGASAAGYDSSIKRPFATTVLNRQKIESGALSKIALQLEYMPVYNYFAVRGESSAIDRWGGTLSAQILRLLPNDWHFSLTPQLQYLASAQSARSGAFHYLLPSVEGRLRSAYGIEASSDEKRSDVTAAGVFVSQKIGFVQQPFFVQQLNLTTPILKSFLEAGIQYASTGAKNFPAVYYEWGGLSPLSAGATASAGFLSRGFPPRMAAAESLFRLSTEWQFTLFKPSWAMSWNRARLNSVESRWIFETVSFTQFHVGPARATEFRVGRQYFTSLGTMLDFWSSAVHYVGFKASGGYFHGFGKFGDDRIAVEMRGWFDL